MGCGFVSGARMARRYYHAKYAEPDDRDKYDKQIKQKHNPTIWPRRGTIKNRKCPRCRGPLTLETGLAENVFIPIPHCITCGWEDLSPCPDE